jgi:hypothetical protein
VSSYLIGIVSFAADLVSWRSYVRLGYQKS